MESNFINHQLSLNAEKRVKDIKGFYTHLFSTLVIPPFLVLINLKGSPQFHWFWYAIGAWCIGLLIHWLNVFVISKYSFKEDWEHRKINQIIDRIPLQENSIEDTNYIQEQYFIKAKKSTKEIKGFYIHLMVSILSLVIIIFVNLKFVPDFYFFWFVLGGMFIGLFFHWLGVFGFEILRLGKNWEEKKIKEFMNEKK